MIALDYVDGGTRVMVVVVVVVAVDRDRIGMSC